MATGRTLQRWAKIYAGGWDLSCSTKTIGPLTWNTNPVDQSTLCDAMKGSLPNQASISAGMLNGIVNSIAAGSSNYILDSNFPTFVGTPKAVAIPIGIRAVPAAGDPCFCGYFNIDSYQAEVTSDGAALINVGFGDWNPANLVNYQKPWGVVLHAAANETAANTGTGIDNGAATAKGGYMLWCGAGGDQTTTTISIDDSANGTDWLALSGATTGAIAYNGAAGGIIQLATTATVRQYLRWQLASVGGTYTSFFLAFVRG